MCARCCPDHTSPTLAVTIRGQFFSKPPVSVACVNVLQSSSMFNIIPPPTKLHFITHGSTEKGEWPSLELLLDSTAALNSGSIIDFDFAIVLTSAFSFPVIFTSKLSASTRLSPPTELHSIIAPSLTVPLYCTPVVSPTIRKFVAVRTANLSPNHAQSSSSSTFRCLGLHPTTCVASYEAAFLSSACTIGAVSAASALLAVVSLIVVVSSPPSRKKL